MFSLFSIRSVRQAHSKFAKKKKSNPHVHSCSDLELAYLGCTWITSLMRDTNPSYCSNGGTSPQKNLTYRHSCDPCNNTGCCEVWTLNRQSSIVLRHVNPKKLHSLHAILLIAGESTAYWSPMCVNWLKDRCTVHQWVCACDYPGSNLNN
jgi:hypothetical protein